MTTTPRDPSSNPNQFAQLLTDAIARRGLSLHRIQSRLEATDLKVSTATLSYWASGRSRPTRSRSTDVVRTLERILEVPPGQLLDALPAQRTSEELSANLVPAIAELPELRRLMAQQSQNWHRLLLHDTLGVGADRRASYWSIRMISRAEVDGLEGWTALFTSEDDQESVIEAVSGVTVGPTHYLPEAGVCYADVRLPRPLRRGETVLSELRCRFGEGGDPVTSFGRAVRHVTNLLVLETRFDGELPSRMERTFEDPQSQTPASTRSVPLDQASPYCVVTDAAPGRHQLTWEWSL